jgi:signal transduction histidine kinase
VILLSLKSLRTKFLVAMLLTTLIAVMAAVVAMIAYDLNLYSESWISDMDTQAELLGQTAAPALEFDDRTLASEDLNLLRLRPQIRSAAIYTARGIQFASYRANIAGTDAPKRPGADGVSVDGRSLVVFKPILKNGEILGKVYIRADYSLYDRMLSYTGIAALAACVAMLIAYLISALLRNVVIRPILAINEIAREVEQKRDYSLRAVKSSEDEVGHLVDSFNNMLAEIERRANDNRLATQALAQEVAERKRSENEVVQLNTQLEERVAKRTRQLEAINEELTTARNDADSANQAKSEFLSRMSHELRTPLNAILGFGDILVSDKIASSPQQKTEFTQQILKAGRHLLALINEILDLAHVESGKLTLSIEPVRVADVLAECQAIMEPLGHQGGIRLMFPEDHGLNALADRMRVKQVMLNLLSNAIKYNRQGGAVVVDVAALGEDRLRISVQDTGVGLQPDQVGGLFQAFNRLGKENGTVVGTGIGLVLTKRLVELMDGKIGVSSTPGIGTIFWIELPATAPTMSAVTESSKPMLTLVHQQGTGIPTLLYIEDNPANLRLVQEIVGFRADLRLLSAPDGKLGLDLAFAHLPNVVLLDINLPGMNGFEIQKILQADPRTAQIPVIALTANAMQREVERGLSAGFFRYLTKPINLEEFSAAIEAALGANPSHLPGPPNRSNAT